MSRPVNVIQPQLPSESVATPRAGSAVMDSTNTRTRTPNSGGRTTRQVPGTGIVGQLGASLRPNPQQTSAPRAGSAVTNSTNTRTSTPPPGEPIMRQVPWATSVSIQPRVSSRSDLPERRALPGSASITPGTATTPDRVKTAGGSAPNPPPPPPQPRPVTPSRPVPSSVPKTARPPPQTPRTSSTVVVIGETAITSPKSSFSWSDLQTLLKKAHNPRFCFSRAVADEWADKGGKGDSCALIGGFHSVLETCFAKRVPPNPWAVRFQGVLFAYMDAPSAKTWADLEQVLSRVAPTRQEQEKLCGAIYGALFHGLQHLWNSNQVGDVHMMMVKASKGSFDQDPVRRYGPLGKAGNSLFTAQDVSKQIFHAEKLDGDKHGQEKVRKLVRAVVIMAENIKTAW